MSECDFGVFRERIIEACRMRETRPDRVAKIIGMGPRRVIDIEYVGLKGLDIHRLAQIADKLDVSIDWLLGRTDNPEINDHEPPPKKAARGKTSAVLGK
jgi:hypothetical protein